MLPIVNNISIAAMATRSIQSTRLHVQQQTPMSMTVLEWNLEAIYRLISSGCFLLSVTFSGHGSVRLPPFVGTRSDG